MSAAVEQWRDEVRDRLSEALRSAGLTQRKLAKELGVTEAAVSQWMNRQSEPDWWTLRRICRLVDRGADWLLGLSAEPGPLSMDTPRGPAEYIPVPFLASEVAAGPGTWNDDEIDTFHAMRAEWVTENVHGRAVRVRVANNHLGESMVNTILPGAVLTVDLRKFRAAEVEPGEIYVVRDENSAVMVKRVYPIPEEKALLCMSDNRAFKPFRIRPAAGGGVIGKVLRWEQGEE